MALVGTGYDPVGVIDTTDDRLFLILVVAGFASVGGFMQYFGALRVGERDRSYSIPLVTNLWNVAHDVTFLISFSAWYDGDYDFWLTKLLWVGMIVWTALEAVVISQILRHSRSDLFGDVTILQAFGIYAVLQAFVFGIFWWFQDVTDDPLAYYGIMTTVIMASAFNIPMMKSRGSRRGVSEVTLWGYVVLSVAFWPWMMLSDDYFRDPLFFLLAVGNIAVSAAAIPYYRSLPVWVPEQAEPTAARTSVATA